MPRPGARVRPWWHCDGTGLVALAWWCWPGGAGLAEPRALGCTSSRMCWFCGGWACVTCEGARVYLYVSVLALGCEKSPPSPSTHTSQSGASEDTHGVSRGSPLGASWGCDLLCASLHALARLRVRTGHRVLRSASGQLVADWGALCTTTVPSEHHEHTRVHTHVHVHSTHLHTPAHTTHMHTRTHACTRTHAHTRPLCSGTGFVDL